MLSKDIRTMSQIQTDDFWKYSRFENVYAVPQEAVRCG